MKLDSETLLIFAYGSLIWRPAFRHEGAQRAVVYGYERRFWQASHDHRGTPELPGRVVTLVPVNGGQCEGLVYALPVSHRESVLQALDEREQDGYERTCLQACLSSDGSLVNVLTWLAHPENPSWAGEGSAEELVKLISSRQGPSGTNREYLLQLHSGLEDLGIVDPHISMLVNQLQRLCFQAGDT